MTSKLQNVNALRAKCKLPPLKHLPREIRSRCEHCLADVSDNELDHERCDTCGRRINVRMTEEEWTRIIRGKA